MSSEENSMRQVEEFDFNGVYIYPVNGTPVDVRNLMEEFVIYEDIYSDSISASVLLIDGLDLTTNLPILGGEKLTIEFRTSGKKKFKKLNFKIYKISDKHRAEKNMDYYWLHLCTPEKYVDPLIGISQAFSGTVDTFIPSILTYLNTSKKLEIDKAVNPMNVVVPHWSPFRTIAFTTHYAHDENLSPYVFFEDMTGYHYKSVRNLLTGASTRDYVYEPRNQTGENLDVDIEKRFYSIKEFNFAPMFDKLKLNMFGAMNQVTYSFDRLHKTSVSKINNSGEIFNNGIHVDKAKLHDDMEATPRTAMTFVRQDYDDSHIAKYINKAVPLLLDTICMRAIIPGDDDLHPGQIISCDIPSVQSIKNGELQYEKYTSGRFLVGSVKHTLKKNGTYTCSIELFKDSLGKSVKGIV